MGEVVYSLCALTSIACAILLVRAWLASRAPLLFWSSLCFVGFTINNLLLVLDLIVFPTSIDLSLPRAITALLPVLALVVGLVRSTK